MDKQQVWVMAVSEYGESMRIQFFIVLEEPNIMIKKPVDLE